MNKKLSILLLVASGLFFVSAKSSEWTSFQFLPNESRQNVGIESDPCEELEVEAHRLAKQRLNELCGQQLPAEQRSSTQQVNKRLQRCEERLDQLFSTRNYAALYVTPVVFPASHSLRTGANGPFSGAHRDDEYSKCNLEESLNRWSRASEARHQTSTQAFPSSIFRGRN